LRSATSWASKIGPNVIITNRKQTAEEKIVTYLKSVHNEFNDTVTLDDIAEQTGLSRQHIGRIIPGIIKANPDLEECIFMHKQMNKYTVKSDETHDNIHENNISKPDRKPDRKPFSREYRETLIKGLSTRQKSILHLIEHNSHITTNMMCDSLGIKRSALSDHLKNLKSKGLITRVGPDKGGYWVVN